MDKQNKALVWDCGSSLYDSFELNSFKRQLDSTIAARTYSMPRLSDPHPRLPTPIPKPTTKSNSKMTFKLSRSVQKFVRSIFGPRSTASEVLFVEDQEQDVVYDRYGGLCAIPEVPEHVGLSPEFHSRVGKSVSERFRPVSIGISCA